MVESLHDVASLLLSDNLMTDIYGANLYNRYLAQQHAMATRTEVVAQGVSSLVKTEAEDKQLVSSAAHCRSILVGFKETSDTILSLLCVHATGLTFLDQILHGAGFPGFHRQLDHVN